MKIKKLNLKTITLISYCMTNPLEMIFKNKSNMNRGQTASFGAGLATMFLLFLLIVLIPISIIGLIAIAYLIFNLYKLNKDVPVNDKNESSDQKYITFSNFVLGAAQAMISCSFFIGLYSTTIFIALPPLLFIFPSCTLLSYNKKTDLKIQYVAYTIPLILIPLMAFVIFPSNFNILLSIGISMLLLLPLTIISSLITSRNVFDLTFRWWSLFDYNTSNMNFLKALIVSAVYINFIFLSAVVLIDTILWWY